MTVLGTWKSIDELEDSITLQELHRLYLAAHRKEYNDKIFLAALQGVKMEPYDDPDYSENTKFEDVKRRAEERRAELFGGKSSNDLEIEDMGFAIEEY